MSDMWPICIITVFPSDPLPLSSHPVSSFVRPDEFVVKGSVTAFKAILDAMIREDKFALCR